MNLMEARCELQAKKPPAVSLKWFLVESAIVLALAAVLVQTFN